MVAQRSRLKRIIGVSSLTLAIFLSSASQSLAQFYAPQPAIAQQNQGLSAENFLGRKWMQGPLHSVASTVQNDGQANRYSVSSRHGTHLITGTEQTRTFIREIYAAEALRGKSTVGTVGGAVGNRVLNLVNTPIEVVGAVGNRLNTIDSVGDAVLLAPRTALDVGEKIVTGTGELLYTGVRLARKVTSSGVGCDSLGNCITGAGENIWSGLNSVSGKNRSARRLHAQFGTDYETRNAILKKEIDRHAYADAYTKSGLLLFAPDTGITEFDDYRDAVGFYDATQTVGGYRDSRRAREEQKARLAARGIPQGLIQAFYQNKVYTRREKVDLIASLESLRPNINIAPFIANAAQANSPYDAKSYVRQYAYLAGLSQAYGVWGFIGTSSPIAITPNGRHILTRTADYLNWTPATAQDVAQLSRLRNPELHIIGLASEEVRQRAQSRGVRVFVTG